MQQAELYTPKDDPLLIYVRDHIDEINEKGLVVKVILGATCLKVPSLNIALYDEDQIKTYLETKEAPQEDLTKFYSDRKKQYNIPDSNKKGGGDDDIDEETADSFTRSVMDEVLSGL